MRVKEKYKWIENKLGENDQQNEKKKSCEKGKKEKEKFKNERNNGK